MKCLIKFYGKENKKVIDRVVRITADETNTFYRFITKVNGKIHETWYRIEDIEMLEWTN